MQLFLSNFTNKIDKKGRVSVPALFRAVISKEDFQGVIVYPSFVNPCIEASGMSRIEKLSRDIDQLDPFSEERDAFATAILGESVQLNFDSDGRIILPKELVDRIKIDELVTFVGKGQTFEIWNPAEFKGYSEKAKVFAKERRGFLGAGKAVSTSNNRGENG